MLTLKDMYWAIIRHNKVTMEDEVMSYHRYDVDAETSIKAYNAQMEERPNKYYVYSKHQIVRKGIVTHTYMLE